MSLEQGPLPIPIKKHHELIRVVSAVYCIQVREVHADFAVPIGTNFDQFPSHLDPFPKWVLVPGIVAGLVALDVPELQFLVRKRCAIAQARLNNSSLWPVILMKRFSGQVLLPIAAPRLTKWG